MTTALLIVDMQNDFVLPDGALCVAGAEATLPRLRALLDFFRARGLPVFHVVREHRADGSDVEITRRELFRRTPYAVPGTPGCEIMAELTPIPGEYRIVKPRFSAFLGTELDFMLRSLGVTDVVVCGTQYPNCIRATIMDATSYGYGVTCVTDATSAQTPEIAAANLVDLANLGVACVTVEEVTQALDA